MEGLPAELIFWVNILFTLTLLIIAFKYQFYVPSLHQDWEGPKQWHYLKAPKPANREGLRGHRHAHISLLFLWELRTPSLPDPLKCYLVIKDRQWKPELSDSSLPLVSSNSLCQHKRAGPQFVKDTCGSCELTCDRGPLLRTMLRAK